MAGFGKKKGSAGKMRAAFISSMVYLVVLAGTAFLWVVGIFPVN